MVNPKVTGTAIGNFHGLEITGMLKKATRGGKDQVWIQIRQTKPKKYRVRESLSYARSVDIEFVDDPE
jgi:hypothetical protein